MTEKELQNKMDFIIEQQAQFMIDVQTLREEQTKAAQRISHLEGAIIAVVGMIGELTKAQKATEETVNVLAGKLDALTDRVDTLTGRIDTVIEMLIERTLGHTNGDKQDGTD